MSAVVKSFDRQSRYTFEPFGAVEPAGAAWLVKGVLPSLGVGFICGASRAGKSFVGLDWAHQIATGRSVLDRRTTQGGVAYVGSEDANGIRLRMKALRQERGGADAPLELIPQAPDLLDETDMADLRVSLTEAAARLAEAGHPLRAVFIDTLSQSMPGADENGSGDMSRVMRTLTDLSDHLGCLVLVIAHVGKDEGRGLRGWSGLTANADAIIMVERDKVQNSRTLTLDKVKNGVDGLRIGFELRIVELGVDDDLDPVSSCVVDYVEAAARTSRKRTLSAHAQKVLSAFHRLFDDSRDCSAPNVAGVKPGTRAVTLAELRTKAADIGLFAAAAPPPDADTAEVKRYRDGLKKAFTRGLERLEQDGLVRSEHGFVWEPRP